MENLENYRKIVGDKVIGAIHKKARNLYGRHLLHTVSGNRWKNGLSAVTSRHSGICRQDYRNLA